MPRPCHVPSLSQEQLTADDITYVGEPLTTDMGTLVVAFFAQFPDSKMVVDVDVLVDAVNMSRDDISTAVSSSAHNKFIFCGNT